MITDAVYHLTLYIVMERNVVQKALTDVQLKHLWLGLKEKVFQDLTALLKRWLLQEGANHLGMPDQQKKQMKDFKNYPKKE